VNFNDLLVLAQNYDAIGTWEGGDFNGDDRVNFNDLLILAQNYAFNDSPTGSFPGDWQMARSLAPEPSLLVAAMLAAGRRPRRDNP
jgi:hypothetical protein